MRFGGAEFYAAASNRAISTFGWGANGVPALLDFCGICPPEDSGVFSFVPEDPLSVVLAGMTLTDRHEWGTSAGRDKAWLTATAAPTPLAYWTGVLSRRRRPDFNIRITANPSPPGRTRQVRSEASGKPVVAWDATWRTNALRIVERPWQPRSLSC